MKYNCDFPVKKGTINNYIANADYAIEFSSVVDDRYSYVLYKTVVFLVDSNKEAVSSGGVKKCTDDYAYVWFWLEPVPDILVDECWNVLEAMTRQTGIKYSFVVIDSNDFTSEDERIINRGYEEFEGLDVDLMAERLGAGIIHDKSFRKLVLSTKK